MASLDDEWDQFLDDESFVTNKSNDNTFNSDIAPDCQELYISTKTKVLFLNQVIDLNNIFWKLPVNSYHILENGIIKKQMKVVSNTSEEFEQYKKNIENIPYYKENIIKQIDNPSARRIKFKDERKITVGLSKKDILNYRGKTKNAFYNCFAIIVRFKYEDEYIEVHIKVFNTGKLEIPGIVKVNILEKVKGLLIEILQPFLKEDIKYIDSPDENVLINSNFNCGFYINRSHLHNILSDNYKIETAFDPCSYPGVKCKYYFNNEKDINEKEQTGKIDDCDKCLKMSDLNESVKYTLISIMIFRTGSCLIVGNCNEKILTFVYEYIKNLLKREYLSIRAPNELNENKPKSLKLKKRKIIVSSEYYDKLTSRQNL